MPISRRWLWIMVVCLFVYWLLRLPALLALPVHTDEGGYVVWSQWVWGERPLQAVEGGKALMVFLAALANPFNQGLFVGRYMTLLLGALGIASAYAVARKVHSPQAGVICALLWLGIRRA
ncbi:MAG: hypothetical protein KF726_14090 [Anaerolineae bacterium]|nr:hypothetical protein [Anaerolineae bacterium]